MLEKNKQKSFSMIKYLWIGVVAINFSLITKIEVADIPYAIGTLLSVLIAGLILSPIIYFGSKQFVNFEWKWFHWFNAIAIIAIVLNIAKWTINPMVNDIATTNSKNHNPNAQGQSKQKPIETAIPSNKSGLCYIYWDGWKFVKGIAPNDSYHTYKIARYEVPLVAMALPKAMGDELTNTAKGSEVDMNNGKFADFFRQQFPYIESLCNNN